MHDVAVLRVAAQNIRYNLAESLWENTLVDVLNGVVYVFFSCAHSAHHIAIVAHFSIFYRFNLKSFSFTLLYII